MHSKFVIKNIICLILFSSIVGLNQTLDSLLEFYPLNKGDYWEYIEEKIDPIYNKYFRTEYSLKVIGDTVLSDSHVYKIIEKCNMSNNYIELFFERIDSVTASIYRFVQDSTVRLQERLIDSLDVQLYHEFSGYSRHSSLPARITLEKISIDTLFNRPVTTLHFSAQDLMWAYEYSFAQHLGLMSGRSVTPEVTFYYTWRLAYARVQGVEYNFETGVKPFRTAMVSDLILLQNYPNPFNLNTVIEYALLSPGNVEFVLYNTLGQEVKTIRENQSSGSHRIVLSSSGFSTGVYFYELKTKHFSMRKKLLVQQ